MQRARNRIHMNNMIKGINGALSEGDHDEVIRWMGVLVRRFDELLTKERDLYNAGDSDRLNFDTIIDIETVRDHFEETLDAVKADPEFELLGGGQTMRLFDSYVEDAYNLGDSIFYYADGRCGNIGLIRLDG